MKNTKLIIAGLTAAITLSGASAVFAEDTTDSSVQAIEKTGTGSGRFQEMEIDMSALELPEGFVPFDEAHVPDGIHAPENGELKPIEFDEDGNMIYGQRPPMFDETEGQRPEFAEGARPAFPGRGTQEMNGERPEPPEGEMPAFEEGERPELPEGEMPSFEKGVRPELPEGEMPAFEEGERPELPDGEMPAFEEGERPELPEGEMPAFEEGERPELPAGEMPAFTESAMPEMQQGGMAFGGSRGQMMGKNI
ncbi:MAG: hypothetical protein K5852_00090 [Eubacterium sp.]|nr:hypothetical protein [Eubacterium sp.]